MLRTTLWLAALGAGASAFAQETDSWEGPATFTTATTGEAPSPVHGILLPDGRLLFHGLHKGSVQPKLGFSAVWTPPADGSLGSSQSLVLEEGMLDYENTTDGATYYVDDNLFCGGQTIAADGSVVTVGGTRVFWSYDATDVSLLTGIFGMEYAMHFDPVTDAWSRTPDLLGVSARDQITRWYPTLTKLDDGQLMLTGSYDYVQVQAFTWNAELGDWELAGTLPGGAHLGIDSYDLGSDTWTNLVDEATTPRRSSTPTTRTPSSCPAIRWRVTTCCWSASTGTRCSTTRTAAPSTSRPRCGRARPSTTRCR